MITLHGNGTIEGISNDNFRNSMPAGSIVQYVKGTTSSVNNRTSHASADWDDTGIQIQITPTKSTNRIVIESFFCVHCGSNNSGGYLSWDNGSLSATELEYQMSVYFMEQQGWRTQSCRYEQIAGTTSQMTFTLRHYRYNTGTVYTGWESGASGDANKQNGAMSVAYEIVV